MKQLPLILCLSASVFGAGPLTTLASAHTVHDQAGSKETHGDSRRALGKPGDPQRISRTMIVEMYDAMRFKPSMIAVKQGETIKFVVKNDGGLKHEMVLGLAPELKEHAEMMKKFPGMEHDDPNQIAVEPGRSGSFVWQFTRVGTFDFACLEPGHMEAGMVGKITVSK